MISRSDHPVCGNLVSFAILIYAAATPPFQGVSQLSCVQTKSKKELRQFYAS
jgi:hypothetical protein